MGKRSPTWLRLGCVGSGMTPGLRRLGLRRLGLRWLGLSGAHMCAPLKPNRPSNSNLSSMDSAFQGVVLDTIWDGKHSVPLEKRLDHLWTHYICHPGLAGVYGSFKMNLKVLMKEILVSQGKTIRPLKYQSIIHRKRDFV